MKMAFVYLLCYFILIGAAIGKLLHLSGREKTKTPRADWMMRPGNHVQTWRRGI